LLRGQYSGETEPQNETRHLGKEEGRKYVAKALGDAANQGGKRSKGAQPVYLNSWALALAALKSGSRFDKVLGESGGGADT